MKNDNLRKGFTLAEIMVALVVIGIITSIILPVAYNNLPSEKVMKFKKANNTLYQVISTLVNSDKYYLGGDLGVKANGNLVNATYLCETFSDVISVKSKHCKDEKITTGVVYEDDDSSIVDTTKTIFGYQDMHAGTVFCMERADRYCKNAQNKMGDEIISADNINYFEVDPDMHFASCEGGGMELWGVCNRLFGNGTTYNDDNGFDRIYKLFCIDIDGINQGEDPFGYGIRADGKILNGKRATEWLEKSIQGE